MAHWWIGFVPLLLQFYLATPQCMVCTRECETLTIKQIAYENISIICEENDENITQFFGVNNFTDTNSIQIVYPLLTNLNLRIFSYVKIINFSYNNLTVFNISALKNVQNLNLSHNNLQQIVGNASKLNYVDLSNNWFTNIFQCQIDFSKIKFLSLNYNYINSLCNLSSDALEHLDGKCNKIESLCLGNLPNLRILDLNNNSIVKINANISLRLPRLEVLNLSSNVIKELNNSNFNLSNLLKLDLKNNKIKHLSPKCFTGLNKLQFLDISQNQITIVFPSTLQYLSGLIQLIISENSDFSSQDFGLLLASKRLKSVNASKTNQKKIPSSLIRSVRYLFLSFNNISQIQCGDLDSYPLLNNLDLAHNNISYIEDDALGRLELLTTIILSYNSLTSIPYTLPNNLRVLLLNNNFITKINSNDFAGITQLKHLDLSSNKITTISEGSFIQLYALQKLNLSGNSIQVLSSSTFTGQQNLKVLDLSFLTNVTKCDQILCFPVPESNELQVLNLHYSPVLVKRLMNDVAALKTFKQLNTLNLAYANLSEIRNDLPNYFPRLRYLFLQGNGLNCSSILSLFSWLVIKETDYCVFEINEMELTTEVLKETTTEKITSKMLQLVLNLNTTNTSSPKLNSPNLNNFFIDFYIPFKNNTEQSILIQQNDMTKNEIWYKESDLGVVDAFAASTPSSHPSLFILLLLPIALVSTCLILNYSRSKRQLDNARQSEMDIEISNISSELW